MEKTTPEVREKERQHMAAAMQYAALYGDQLTPPVEICERLQFILSVRGQYAKAVVLRQNEEAHELYEQANLQLKELLNIP